MSVLIFFRLLSFISMNIIYVIHSNFSSDCVLKNFNLEFFFKPFGFNLVSVGDPNEILQREWLQIETLKTLI